MDYRREVDGLRALAVLPVLFFHAGFKTFSGGFVGVDVFFVISGYLITAIILAEKQAGTFSIIKFYERRARRILPALFFVMFSCLPFAWLWLLPQDMKSFSQSLVAVSAFASNILFWQSSGYFDIATELKPLLHTWSLAVEEQYYLLFPVFLMLAWRLGKRWILGLLAAAFAASLAAAHWGSVAKPEAAFYLLPTRGWELLIGVFVAFYFSGRENSSPAKPLSEAGGALGLALIVYAIFAFDKETPFPSLYTLLPTIGTALILLYATHRTVVGKLLGNKIFVGIGLISYSTYLWHQPLYSFARHRILGEPSKLLFGFLAVLSIVLAYFSWKYVEAPFRNKATISRRNVFYFSGVGTVFFIVIGGIGFLNKGFDSRLPPNLVWESMGAKVEKKGVICEPKAVDGYPGVLACDFGDKGSGKAMFLYGDSHAQAISEELNKTLASNNIRGVKVALDACHVVPTVRDAREISMSKDECLNSFQSLHAYIKNEKADIIVASRWSFRLYPISGEIEDMPARNSEGGLEREPYKEFVVVNGGKVSYGAKEKKAALEELVRGLLSTGQAVYLIYPVPEISWDIAKLNYDFYRRNGQLLGEISIPYNDFRTRNRFVNGVFDGLTGNKKLIPIRPESIFCNTFVKGRCVAQYGSVPFYYDDDHLSDKGAHLVVDKIFTHISK